MTQNGNQTANELERDDGPARYDIAGDKMQKRAKPRKQRITVQISEDVIERVKNSVYWTPGLTLAGLAEIAFAKAVDLFEEERGAPFPKRKEELKTGRPIN